MFRNVNLLYKWRIEKYYLFIDVQLFINEDCFEYKNVHYVAKIENCIAFEYDTIQGSNQSQVKMTPGHQGEGAGEAVPRRPPAGKLQR